MSDTFKKKWKLWLLKIDFFQYILNISFIQKKNV